MRQGLRWRVMETELGLGAVADLEETQEAEYYNVLFYVTLTAIIKTFQ